MEHAKIKSQRVYRFVEEYAKDRNGTQAAIRAGYAPNSAGEQAVALLADPRISALVAEQIAKISKVVEFEAADVLREWVMLATADPAKIAKIRQVNCRHCWGENHEYQWNAREYAKACDAALAHVNKKGVPDPKPMPDCSGGFGWRHNTPPNPECPECAGEGIFDTLFANMDALGPAERKLIAAVERTKDGVKVKMRDQDAAVQNIAKYLGLLVERKEVTGKNGGPLGVAVIPGVLPDDAAMLATLYAQIVGGG